VKGGDYKRTLNEPCNEDKRTEGDGTGRASSSLQGKAMHREKNGLLIIEGHRIKRRDTGEPRGQASGHLKNQGKVESTNRLQQQGDEYG